MRALEVERIDRDYNHSLRFLSPVVFTNHARQRMLDRGAREEDVLEAIRIGQREPAQRGLSLYRLNVEFQREWDGKHYSAQQVAPRFHVEATKE